MTGDSRARPCVPRLRCARARACRVTVLSAAARARAVESDEEGGEDDDGELDDDDDASSVAHAVRFDNPGVFFDAGGLPGLPWLDIPDQLRLQHHQRVAEPPLQSALCVARVAWWCAPGWLFDA